MSETNIFYKQSKLYNPQENNPQIHIYGVGSIGSHTVIALAKIGITNITVYDYDHVEQSNIPAQFYNKRQGETRLQKTECIKYMAEHMTGTTINVQNIKIDENFTPNPSINSIHILAFDNIEARQLITSKLDGYPVHIIDGRIGGFQYEKYYLKANNETTYKKYTKTLQGTFTELECGSKTLWINNSILASKIVADVIKITQGKTPNGVLKGHGLSDTVISGEL